VYTTFKSKETDAMDLPFADRVRAAADRLSPAEHRVAQYFAGHREELLLASAAALARSIGTSDATVVRTAKALGFEGLDALRRAVAEELRRDLSPAGRVARTLQAVGPDAGSALAVTLDLHAEAIAALGRSVPLERFDATVGRMLAADRIAVFGIGPSGAIADYLAIQLGRFGLDSIALTQTGLLLADRLLRLRRGDLLLMLAYGRVYGELRATLDRADELRLCCVLITDTLGAELAGRVDTVLDIPRGRVDTMSLHTATLAFIEALLVGIAARRPERTLESLRELNRLRAAVAGPDMAL
jgi:DNA-binding MurR/RpiR family transcriptional regulator